MEQLKKLEIIFFKIKGENNNIQKSSRIYRNYTQDINKLKFFTTRIGKKVKVLIGFARLKMIHRRGRLPRITYDYYYTFIRIFHFVSVLGLFKKLCFIIELSIYVIYLYLPGFFLFVNDIFLWLHVCVILFSFRYIENKMSICMKNWLSQRNSPRILIYILYFFYYV